MRQPHSRCKDCHRVVTREWHKRRWHTDADWRKRRQSRYLKDNADPEAYATHLAQRRESRRRIHGFTPRTIRAQQHGGTTANAKPFLDWLKSEWDNPNQAATALGINPRRIQDVWYGRQERLELDTIDRALTNYGRPDLLDVLVPLDNAA